jgi:hypothetical protein
VVNTVVTVEEPFDETLVIGVLNDFFAETLTADMFTLGGILKDAVVTDVEKTDGDQSVKLTVKASSMRSVGKGTVTVSGKGTQTGRMASGAVLCQQSRNLRFSTLRRTIRRTGRFMKSFRLAAILKNT